MSIRRRRSYSFKEPVRLGSQTFFDHSGGLNTRDSALNVGETDLVQADNLRYTAQGAFKTRPGTQRLGNRIGTTTKILGLHSYVQADLGRYLLATFNTDIYSFSETGAIATIATTTDAQGVGYAKDRKVFMTTANTDANGNPFTVVLYQAGDGINLEWEDSPYGTWTNALIDIDATTALGFFGYMDSDDNIHIVYDDGSNPNVVEYRKLTYGAGPTWTVGSAVAIVTSSTNTTKANPCIFRRSDGRLVVAYRYFDGTNYSVRSAYSDDSGATWVAPTTDLSTASTNARHMATMTSYNNNPLVVYQVGGASSTSYFYRLWNNNAAAWTTQISVGSTTSATDNAFTAVVTGSILEVRAASVTSDTGLSITAFSNASGAQQRVFDVVNDGADDNDIFYTNVINGDEDATGTRITNNSDNNVYPTSPEYVATGSTYVPVMWIEGTGTPWNIKINTSTNWTALSASLTTNLAMNSAYFPKTAAGGTDMIYLTNGTDTVKKWDDTTLTSAHADWPKPLWIFHMDGRLWMGNYGSTQNRATYTNLGADGFGAALPSGNNVDFPEYLVWGHHYRDSIGLIFTRSAIYVINSFSYSGSNVGPESVRKMPNSYGTLSGRTVKQIGYWVYFQSPDGQVRRTNGNYVELVSDKIRGTIADLAPAQLTNAAAGAIGDLYFLAVTNSGSGNNDLILVLDTSIWERTGGGWSVDTGKSASCFVTHPDANGVPQLFYGESDTTDGSVYQMETGTSDNGSAIAFAAKTGFKPFGNPRTKKLFHDLDIYATASGEYDLTVGYAPFEYSATGKTFNVALDTNAPIWGQFVWGEFVWGGKSNVYHTEAIDTEDRLLAFTFSHSAADEPVEIFGYGASFTTLKDEL